MTYTDDRAAALSGDIDRLIAYVRRSYPPTAPTARLLAAYEAQQAELARLSAENAALRQALALNNLELNEDDRAGVARLSDPGASERPAPRAGREANQ